MQGQLAVPDRLPVAAIVVPVYFGLGRSHVVWGLAAFVVAGALLVWDIAKPVGRRHRAALLVAHLLAGSRGPGSRAPGSSEGLH
jgi:hypothetical protein